MAVIEGGFCLVFESEREGFGLGFGGGVGFTMRKWRYIMYA